MQAGVRSLHQKADCYTSPHTCHGCFACLPACVPAGCCVVGRTTQVVLHMELLLGQHQPQPNSPQSASAAAAGHPDGQPTSTAQADTPVRDSLPSASDPAAAVTPLPTNGTQQQQQQHTTDAQPRQQLKLKRVLRGDASKSYIMRPGSSSWSAVSQVRSMHTVVHVLAQQYACGGCRGNKVQQDCLSQPLVCGGCTHAHATLRQWLTGCLAP